MKTIYTLAIAIMSGVILTACGTTPITINSVNPDDSIIKRCIMEDLASDASCAPIVEKHPCILNPFGGACDVAFTDYYKTAQANRISFCRENINDNLCVSAIESVCADNPFNVDFCPNFSSQTFVLSSNLSIQASTASRNELSNVAFRYLTSINFEGYERQDTIDYHAILGNDFDVDNTSLGATDGILVMQTSGSDGSGGHVFAGRLGSTDVGPAFSDTDPTATFSGRAVILLVHNSPVSNSGTSLENVVSFDDLELTANFGDGTLRGSNTNSLGENLDVNASINNNILTGAVGVTFTNSAIIKAANRSFFHANLTGRIGENGAVGTFASHLARRRASDYALGGGFVVKPIPASQ